MRTPAITGGALGLVAVAAVLFVLAQQRELAGLRAEQSRVLAQLGSEPKDVSVPPRVAATSSSEPGMANSELLQLRSEITRLTQRKRELADVVAENDKLRGQAAARRVGGGGRLILANKARMAGFNTPEDTLESVLWSLEHADFTNFLQAFTPEVAQAFPIQSPEVWTNAMGKFHEEFAGMTILNRQELPDGRVELTVQMAGHSEAEQPIHLRQVNGQWKIDEMK